MISRVNNGLDSNAARGKKAQQEREVKDKGGDKGMVRFSLFLPYCDVYFYCTICDQRYSNKHQNRHPFATDRLTSQKCSWKFTEQEGNRGKRMEPFY